MLSADLHEANSQKGRASEKAAEMLNVSRRLVEYAAKVLKEAEPELVKAARVSIRLDAKQGRFLGS